MVLLIKVKTGKGKQSFITQTLNKIARLKKKKKKKKLKIDIQVDGGINLETAPKVIRHGANVLVAGSAVYGSNDIKGTIAQLKQQ